MTSVVHSSTSGIGTEHDQLGKDLTLRDWFAQNNRPSKSTEFPKMAVMLQELLPEQCSDPACAMRELESRYMDKASALSPSSISTRCLARAVQVHFMTGSVSPSRGLCNAEVEIVASCSREMKITALCLIC